MEHAGVAAGRIDGNGDREVPQFDLISHWPDRTSWLSQQHRAVRLRPGQKGRRGSGGEYARAPAQEQPQPSGKSHRTAIDLNRVYFKV